MASIISVLERLGNLEWYAVRPSELLTSDPRPVFPPLITFRYNAGNDYPYKVISEAIGTFRGKVRWTLVGEGEKNLCLMPERVRQTSLSGVSTMGAVQQLIESDSDFVRLANHDFDHLVDHLGGAL